VVLPVLAGLLARALPVLLSFAGGFLALGGTFLAGRWLRWALGDFRLAGRWLRWAL
jgi:hypothetical protein